MAVTTNHYDTYRTGWNAQESDLTYSSVTSGTFGLQATVAVDDQIDAQPLVIPHQLVAGDLNAGQHDVVYVATQNNTIYAIDPTAGTILLSRNLGPPVVDPINCDHDAYNDGITSTPVIDTTTNTIYVMSYTFRTETVKGHPVVSPYYRLYALDLSTLADQTAPVEVSATATLTDGTSFNFNPRLQRQRPALLEAGGTVYAGFGGFCDIAAARGWLLGWQTGTLTPLPAALLTDRHATAPHHFFLTSIWMSGAGPAVDQSGALYFVTGNSDPGGTTYDGVTNIQESAVRISPTLDTLLDIFTPHEVSTLDRQDRDFGSGGIMLLPTQSGAFPHLAVASGKSGMIYLLNRDDMGGWERGPGGTDDVLFSIQNHPCFCAPSYFADTTSNVVTSGGQWVRVWQLNTAGATPTLVERGQSPKLPTGQGPGFFTTVSSNGAGDPIVWAVTHPVIAGEPAVTLHAIAAQLPAGARTNILPELFTSVAGTWPNDKRNANIVPVVANGRVYVASYKQLAIFGLAHAGPTAAATTAATALALPAGPAPTDLGGAHEWYGTIATLSGARFTIATRSGTRTVDASAAQAGDRVVPLYQGRPVDCVGTVDSAGVLHADTVAPAKDTSEMWPGDR